MSFLNRHAECKRSVCILRSLRCQVIPLDDSVDRVTRNGTFGSSVASAAVLTADIDGTVTTKDSREFRARLAEIQRSRLEQGAVTAVTDIASSESGFARRGDRWSTSVWAT